jgi:hypothetical protein
MPIIEVEHLTKEYQLGTITSIKDSFTNALRRLTGKPPIERERFKAPDALPSKTSSITAQV